MFALLSQKMAKTLPNSVTIKTTVKYCCDATYRFLRFVSFQVVYEAFRASADTFFGRGCLLAVNIVEIMGVTHAASGIVGKDRAMRCHDRTFKTKFFEIVTGRSVQQSP